MMRYRESRRIGRRLALGLFATVLGGSSVAQEPSGAAKGAQHRQPSPASGESTPIEVKPLSSPLEERPDAVTLSEAALIAQIRSVIDQIPAAPSPEAFIAAIQPIHGALLEEIAALESRYPTSPLLPDALLLRVRIYAYQARVDSTALGLLFGAIARAEKSQPPDPIAAELDFCSIQAFVLGARSEQMPEDRRLRGTAERYRAFLEEHPESPRVPVVAASLVRVLLQLGRVDEARPVVAMLKNRFSESREARRAEGELFRATGIGKPFPFAFQLSDGTVLSNETLRGKVVLIHFWASWRKRSVEDLPRVRQLRAELGEDRLALIGVNLDVQPDAFREVIERVDMPWFQYVDGKGLRNEMLLATGVRSLPHYMVVDASGVLRASEGHAANAIGLVRELLAAQEKGKDEPDPNGP